MKENRRNLYIASGALLTFAIWTAMVCFVGRAPIGPQGTEVGLAAINGAFHRLTGVNMTLYTVTDWLGLVPFAVAAGFAMLGLVQWIKRKNLFKVDFSLFVLGGLYIVTIAAYIFFEIIVINYRPVLIEGRLEASYPSSTTMLVMCVMPAAAIELSRRIRVRSLKYTLVGIIAVFTLFMVIARLLSGVHWVSDIVGGALLSTGLVMMYRYVLGCAKIKCYKYHK